MSGASSLEGCLGALETAVAAATSLGVDPAGGRGVLAEAHDRLGLSPDVYVLGLVGGTGVGKSSLLNALAGRIVVDAGPRRPTTDHPVAWLPEAAEVVAGPILDRFGVLDRRVHERADLGPVVVLDLPDVDSVAAAHRATVEALLPRIDAVAWVTDPEKYADSILHDVLLRTWLPRLGRQVLVLNKADRLRPGQLDEVRADLARAAARDTRDGRTAAVLATSAVDGAPGIAPLVAWLGSETDAKRIVAARLSRAARSAVAELALEAGVDPARPLAPLLDPKTRERAVSAAVAETLRIVDLPGARERAVAATRAAARRTGTGPLGRITATVYRASGRERRVADPGRYLGAWRERGTAARPIEPLAAAAAEALAAAPAALRPRVASDIDPVRLAGVLAGAADRAIGSTGELRPPTSRLWRLLGLLQTADALVVAFAVAWIVLWVLVRPPVGTIDVPLLGAVPQPLVLLAIALLAGFLVARSLAWHAGVVGRRWAGDVAGRVRRAVEEAVATEAFAALDRIDEERAAMRAAAARAADACG